MHYTQDYKDEHVTHYKGHFKHWLLLALSAKSPSLQDYTQEPDYKNVPFTQDKQVLGPLHF